MITYVAMSYDHNIYIKMRKDLREDLDAHYNLAKEKAQEEQYTFSQHVRKILRQAVKRARKPSAQSADSGAADIVPVIARIWDEEMPANVARMGTKSEKRKASIMARYKEVPEIESWRLAIRALSRDEYHTKRKNFSVEYLLRPSHFSKWIDAGAALSKEADHVKGLAQFMFEEGEARD